MKPSRNRLEAIQKLQPPRRPKGCRSFAGVVNFFSMFSPELQKLLKPIYDLTRKGRPFYWGEGTTGLIYGDKTEIDETTSTAYAK